MIQVADVVSSPFQFCLLVIFTALVSFLIIIIVIMFEISLSLFCYCTINRAANNCQAFADQNLLTSKINPKCGRTCCPDNILIFFHFFMVHYSP